MTPKLILTKIQKEIFKRLSQNKYYYEIADELDITVNDIEDKVKSVFCLVGFQNVTKDILQIEVLGEREN
jgi:DNA-binding CsgD family transcriptional regulator